MAGIAPTKIRNFAQQAKALDAGELLTWEECNADLKEFCRQMDLPDTATGFVKDLKTKLTETAARVDQKG